MPKNIFRLLATFCLTSWTILGLSGCNGKTLNAASEAPTDEKFRDFLPGVSVAYSSNIAGETEPCGCRTNPTGGVHRRWNLQKQKIIGERITLDSGDLFYKSTPVPPFLSKQWNYQAEVLADAMNELGLDVFSPGELDLAAGLEQFMKIKRKIKFKVVSANLYEKASGKRIFDPYVVITKNNKRIGIFGIIDESIPLSDEITAKDHLAAARETVAELRKKSDIVLALTHEGLEKDRELAKLVTGIDAIFGAHTESFLITPEKVGDTLIFQTSFRGQHLGVFENGFNHMYQVDARFDSPSDKLNPLDKLVANSKEEIARINKETETELFSAKPSNSKPIRAEVQTFARCAECHVPQYNFHKNTPHMHAYQTLVKAKQNNNFECLKCHTVGLNQPGGWNHVSNLALNAVKKPVDPENFSKSLPQMKIESLAKMSKTFLNVQCENCHGPAGEHPFSGNYSKQVSTNTCLECHTLERAPNWYKDGKIDPAILKAKLKSMTCP